MEKDLKNLDDAQKELADIKRELEEVKVEVIGNQEKHEEHK